MMCVHSLVLLPLFSPSCRRKQVNTPVEERGPSVAVDINGVPICLGGVESELSEFDSDSVLSSPGRWQSSR